MAKKASGIWTVFLVIFFLYLLYQSTFAWNVESGSVENNVAKLPVEKTAFLKITDKHYGVQSSGISKIQKSLEMWSLDSQRDKVFLKHSNLLPTKDTQMMVIYDKGSTSFETHSDVLSLIKFPYKHSVNNNLVFEMDGVGAEGDIYMTYKNQKIHLNPGESFHTMSFEGFMITKTTIQNMGLYNKTQFNLMGTVEEQEGRVKGPQAVDVNMLEKKPLEAAKESAIPEEFFDDAGKGTD